MQDIFASQTCPVRTRPDDTLGRWDRSSVHLEMKVPLAVGMLG